MHKKWYAAHIGLGRGKKAFTKPECTYFWMYFWRRQDATDSLSMAWHECPYICQFFMYSFPYIQPILGLHIKEVPPLVPLLYIFLHTGKVRFRGKNGPTLLLVLWIGLFLGIQGLCPFTADLNFRTPGFLSKIGLWAKLNGLWAQLLD